MNLSRNEAQWDGCCQSIYLFPRREGKGVIHDIMKKDLLISC